MRYFRVERYQGICLIDYYFFILIYLDKIEIHMENHQVFIDTTLALIDIYILFYLI